MPLHNVTQMLLFVLLILAGVSGFVALVSPRHFRTLAGWSARWVDGERYLAVLDKRVDIDGYVLRHCRVLGSLVIVSVLIIGFVWVAR